MPETPRYPGVYVEETSAGSHTISAGTTSTAAFVDVFERGPAHVPVRITNIDEFTRIFGRVDRRSRASHGIFQFFENGGATAWVVRTTQPGDTNAKCSLGVFDLIANGPGVWGNNMQAAVQPTATPGLVDLVIRELSTRTALEEPRVTNVEIYPGVGLDPAQARHVADVVGLESRLVSVVAQSVMPSMGRRTPSPADSILGPRIMADPLASAFATFTGGSADLRFDTAAGLGRRAEPTSGAGPTGMYALDHIAPSTFDLLCLPAMAGFDAAEWLLAFDKAVDYCEEHRAFLIVDPPSAAVTTADAAGQTQQIVSWFTSSGIAGRTANGAIYFPRVIADDPESGAPLETESSGTMAGIYARTDAARGVWKAPAGVDANLVGARPTVAIDDGLNDTLNRRGINAIRSFPVRGAVSWGARTLAGADELAGEWKYVNVRRLGLYIERALSTGTAWAVFEPNDEPLWASLRLAVDDFMAGLFRQGALAGQTAREAFFVRCDASTTTAADMRQGRVNIVVGFAPLKPAEFIVITITHRTQQ